MSEEIERQKQVDYKHLLPFHFYFYATAIEANSNVLNAPLCLQPQVSVHQPEVPLHSKLAHLM